MNFQQKEQLIRHSLIRVIKCRCPGWVDKALAGESYARDCCLNQLVEQLEGLFGPQSLGSAHIKERVEQSRRPSLIQSKSACQQCNEGHNRKNRARRGAILLSKKSTFLGCFWGFFFLSTHQTLKVAVMPSEPLHPLELLPVDYGEATTHPNRRSWSRTEVWQQTCDQEVMPTCEVTITRNDP